MGGHEKASVSCARTLRSGLILVVGIHTKRPTLLVVGVSGGMAMNSIIEKSIIHALSSGPKSRHELAEIAGLEPRQVMPHLVRLRQAGRIVVNGVGDYELAFGGYNPVASV
jgi:predicted Rossmann fold nucleotide-binding protein DprA/Smf involved in DNA uptake